MAISWTLDTQEVWRNSWREKQFKPTTNYIFPNKFGKKKTTFWGRNKNSPQVNISRKKKKKTFRKKQPPKKKNKKQTNKALYLKEETGEEETHIANDSIEVFRVVSEHRHHENGYCHVCCKLEHLQDSLLPPHTWHPWYPLSLFEALFLSSVLPGFASSVCLSLVFCFCFAASRFFLFPAPCAQRNFKEWISSVSRTTAKEPEADRRRLGPQIQEEPQRGILPYS